MKYKLLSFIKSNNFANSYYDRVFLWSNDELFEVTADLTVKARLNNIFSPIFFKSMVLITRNFRLVDLLNFKVHYPDQEKIVEQKGI